MSNFKVYNPLQALHLDTGGPGSYFLRTTTIVTFGVQPQVAANLSSPSWGYVFPALALGGLAAAFAYRRQGTGLRAFLGSCLYIAGMLSSAAFGVYPYVLPSNQEPNLGLTIYNTASAHYGLVIGLVWWIPGVILAAGYFVYIHRQFAGKVEESADYGSGSAE